MSLLHVKSTSRATLEPLQPSVRPAAQVAREIAAELDIGFSAAAVRLHRLIQKLKGRMGLE